MSLINLNTIITQISSLQYSRNKINVEDKINGLLQKLNNESFEVFLFDYVELNDIYHFNHNVNVLMYPIRETHDENIQMLNSIFTITRNNYLNMPYVERITLLQNYNVKNYLKQENINLFIIQSENTISFYDNSSNKNIVIVKVNNHYITAIHATEQFYENENNFIITLKKMYDESNIMKECVKHKEIVMTPEDEFIEYHEDEAAIKTEIKIEKNKNDLIKKPKKNKNIFIAIDHEIEKNEPTFIKTVEIDREEILKKTKLTLTLSELQNIALQLNISIVAGLTKTNTPKNKTKLELYNNIVDFLKK